MLSDYKVFDGHCDSVTMKNLLHTKIQLNSRDMHKYQGYIQVFSICSGGRLSYCHNRRFIKRYDRLVSNWGIDKILTADDFSRTVIIR